VIFFLALFFFLNSADAATSYKVNASTTSTITEYGVCKKVTNSNAKAMMVATNSSTAWANFLAHVPPSVSVASCPSPTFIQEVETDWNTSTNPKTTASFDVQAGDILVAYLAGENGNSTFSISGGSLTWTLQNSVHSSTIAEADVWTATVDTNKTMTVTMNQSVSSIQYGYGVITFRNSSGVGATSKKNASSAAPSLNLTTTKADSAIVWVNGDWAAVNGSSRTYRTGAGTFNETSYYYGSGIYTAYAGYHTDAGSIGTYAVGMTAPSTQTYSIIAVEIKGP
jgi:hypothetical protein